MPTNIRWYTSLSSLPVGFLKIISEVGTFPEWPGHGMPPCLACQLWSVVLRHQGPSCPWGGLGPLSLCHLFTPPTGTPGPHSHISSSSRPGGLSHPSASRLQLSLPAGGTPSLPAHTAPGCRGRRGVPWQKRAPGDTTTSGSSLLSRGSGLCKGC